MLRNVPPRKSGPLPAADRATSRSTSQQDHSPSLSQPQHPADPGFPVKQAQSPIPFGHPLRQHPEFVKLLLDRDYYRRPMMPSVRVWN